MNGYQQQLQEAIYSSSLPNTIKSRFPATTSLCYWLQYWGFCWSSFFQWESSLRIIGYLSVVVTDCTMFWLKN